MTDINRLVVTLSNLDPLEDSSEAAREVAEQVLSGVLKERWRASSEARKTAQIRDSANRLWAGYSSRLGGKALTPRDAAYEAIQEELALLRNFQ